MAPSGHNSPNSLCPPVLGLGRFLQGWTIRFWEDSRMGLAHIPVEQRSVHRGYWHGYVHRAYVPTARHCCPAVSVPCRYAGAGSLHRKIGVLDWLLLPSPRPCDFRRGRTRPRARDLDGRHTDRPSAGLVRIRHPERRAAGRASFDFRRRATGDGCEQVDGEPVSQP